MSMRLSLGACLGAAALVLLGTPAAAESDPLVVEVVGGGPLLETAGMYPGIDVESAPLRVSNTTTEAGSLTLRIDGVVSDDNGCNDPESVVDSTCGSDEGELANQVVVSVERRASDDTWETVAADRPLAELTAGVSLEDPLPAGETRVYRLTLHLPAASGNETQTDSIDFDVTVVGEAVAGAEVLGATDFGVRATTGLALPATGTTLTAPLFAAVCCLAVGGGLVGMARRRGDAPASGGVGANR